MIDQEKFKLRCQLIKEEYGDLFDQISATLFEADPIGINFETNTDEYESEVRTILLQLKDTRSVKDVEKIVYKEFCFWFGVDTAGPRKKYHPIAVKIWGLWCEYKNHKSYE
jgi:hypothetical protein